MCFSWTLILWLPGTNFQNIAKKSEREVFHGFLTLGYKKTFICIIKFNLNYGNWLKGFLGLEENLGYRTARANLNTEIIGPTTKSYRTLVKKISSERRNQEQNHMFIDDFGSICGLPKILK